MLTNTFSLTLGTQLNLNTNHHTAHTPDFFLTSNTLLITNTDIVPGPSDHAIVLVDSNLRPVREKCRRGPTLLFSRATWLLKRTTFCHLTPTLDPLRKLESKTPLSRHTAPWFSRDLNRQHQRKRRLYRHASTGPLLNLKKPKA